MVESQQQNTENQGHSYVTGHVPLSSRFSRKAETSAGSSSPFEKKAWTTASEGWNLLASWPKKHPTMLVAVLALCGGIAIGIVYGQRSK